MQAALLVLVPLAQYQCCRPLQPNWAVHCSTPGMQTAEDQCNRVSMFCEWQCVPQQCCRPKQPKSRLQLSVINQRILGLSFEKTGFTESNNRKQNNKCLMDAASVDTLGDWSKFPFGQQRGLPLC